jgi:hypothetical protein
LDIFKRYMPTSLKKMLWNWMLSIFFYLTRVANKCFVFGTNPYLQQAFMTWTAYSKSFKVLVAHQFFCDIVAHSCKLPFRGRYDWYEPKTSSTILFYEQWAFHWHPSWAYWPPTAWAVGHASATIFASAVILNCKKSKRRQWHWRRDQQQRQVPVPPPSNIPGVRAGVKDTKKSRCWWAFVTTLAVWCLICKNWTWKIQHGLSLILSGAWVSL